MAGSQRLYRQRIATTEALEKIFRAMELIAASRIGKARAQAQAARPYTEALNTALAALAPHFDEVRHPLLDERHDTTRVAVLLLTADRGMAGAYNANVIREAERLVERLTADGKEHDLYVLGRRGIGYFSYRDRGMVRTWSGWSDSPTKEQAYEVADTMLQTFLAPADAGGVRELYVVFTDFRNMVTQEPRVIRMLPLEIETVEDGPEEVMPLYEFMPSPQRVLNALLPRYIRSRIFDCVLQAAASELAARQSAMHTATENAEDLIHDYTRLANAARQSEITQELSEIVSGADALAAD